MVERFIRKPYGCKFEVHIVRAFPMLLADQPLEVDATILESVFPTIEQAIRNRVRARLRLHSSIPANFVHLSNWFAGSASWRTAFLLEKRVLHGHTVEQTALVPSGMRDPHTTAEETCAAGH